MGTYPDLLFVLFVLSCFETWSGTGSVPRERASGVEGPRYCFATPLLLFKSALRTRQLVTLCVCFPLSRSSNDIDRECPQPVCLSIFCFVHFVTFTDFRWAHECKRTS